LKKIVCFGPGPLFKGGISNYTTALAQALRNQPDTEVHIVSWTQQYPAIIPRDFIDRSSQKGFLVGSDIQVHYLTNYNNPVTWEKTASFILDLKPDLIILQWAIALQGLPMGWIARRLKKAGTLKIMFDLHLVVQKEGSRLDQWFTKYGLEASDGYIVHAKKTGTELQTLFPDRKFKDPIELGGKSFPVNTYPLLQLYHPVYNLFKEDPLFDREAFRKSNGLQPHVFLFFGFIRKYKGLHQVIQSFAKALETRKDISLLIVGESFWQTLDQNKFSTRIKQQVFGFAKSMFLKKTDDEQNYRPLELIKTLGIENYVRVFNDFVPNEEVHKYFQASDTLMLYYLNATPSGVESLGYNFRLPILATRVGHFTETIQDGYNGYLAESGNIEDMAKVMLKSITHPISKENIEATASQMSWDQYAKRILNS
jgi:glycosyltransferase involved in cell wall biosynthesis